MPAPEPTFDPYHVWLQIPRSEQPPNHYRLLGLDAFENDREVIRSAADKQMLYLKTFCNGPNAEVSQRVLNEVSNAKLCLLDDARRSAYDRELRTATISEEPADDIARVEINTVERPIRRQHSTMWRWIVGTSAVVVAGCFVIYRSQFVARPTVTLEPVQPTPNTSPRDEQLEPGLVVEVFDGKMNFENRIFATVTTVSLNHQWQDGPLRVVHDQPEEQTIRDHCSIRWTGLLDIPATGEYEFQMVVGDAGRLWIDGQLLFEHWRPGGVTLSATRSLTRGSHTIRVDYHEVTQGAEISLKWRSNRKSDFDVIPASAFRYRTIAPNEVSSGIDRKDTKLGRFVGWSSYRSSHRHNVVEEFGGNADVDLAIQRGLKWLASNTDDGAWQMGSAPKTNYVAATALAVLAFQAAGNSVHRGEYKSLLATASERLLDRQREDGGLYVLETQAHYSHPIATMALCDAYAMTLSDRFRGPAVKALEYCLEAQQENGGWGYLSGQPHRTDTSITGWFLAAFSHGQQSPLVPFLEGRIEKSLASATRFYELVQLENGAAFRYREGHNAPSTSMRASGLCGNLICQPYKNIVARRSGANVLMATPPEWTASKDYYYWYWSTQLMFRLGGEYWDGWYPIVRDMLVEHQETDGSWSNERSMWKEELGVHGATCFALLILQTPFLHAPPDPSFLAEMVSHPN